MLQVVLQDHLAGVVDGAADRRQLDQDLGTVPALLHHGLDPLQVADGPGQTVDHRPGLGVAVGMAVAMFVGDAVLDRKSVV